MNELKTTLQKTLDKHKKEYASKCDSSGGIASFQDNAKKFDPAMKGLIKEITINLNEYLNENPEKDREQIIALGQEYGKMFGTQLSNPFS